MKTTCCYLNQQQQNISNHCCIYNHKLLYGIKSKYLTKGENNITFPQKAFTYIPIIFNRNKYLSFQYINKEEKMFALTA